MYIRFVLDPFVPHGTNKIIRRVIKDLRNIFEEVLYSVETDESIVDLYQNKGLPVSKIFQRKISMSCRGIVIYLLSTKVIWHREPILGLSIPSRCVIGMSHIPKHDYKEWSSLIWELILHELGHSLGLIQKNRKNSIVGYLSTRHCINNCVMSEDLLDSVWKKKAKYRYLQASPYCEMCLSYLLKKNT
ncbi:MAG: hypothetical protein WCT07_01230 [Candidatus Paceibacterota bacterium]